MDAKRYVVYRPDESDMTCRVYVRCDCSRFERKHECDPCEEEHDKEKNCDDKRKDWDDHRWEPERPEKEQTHVHEFLGSTKLAEECEDRHNHRFAGVSSEEIPIPGGHIHRIVTHTDFFDHFHDICKLTGPAIEVEDKEMHCKGNSGENKKRHEEKKHVHFVEGWTTFVDGHKHEFQLATLIESPLLPQPKRDD